MKLKDYLNLKMQQDPEFEKLYEEMKQELILEAAGTRSRQRKKTRKTL